MDPTDWEGMWNEGERPRFDKLQPHPALVSLLESESLLLGSGGNISALVPGCGPGYEVVALAQRSMVSSVIGLDIAPTGVAAAKANALEKCSPDVLAKIKFICGDFFEFDGPPNGFNLAIDYTFLCALPPVLREKWAETYARLLADGGILLTLMYPLGKPAEEGGPPFGLSFGLYESLLSKWFEPVERPSLLPDSMVHPGREGGNKNGICRWLRLPRS